MKTHRERVEFRLLAPHAEQVFLVGSFNGWSVGADPMKQDKSGVWKKSKKLVPGRYEYKFITDGEWVLDPDCHESISNPHGTANNVVEVKEGSGSAAKKDAYIAKMEEKKDKWNAELSRLEEKFEEAKGSARVKYHRQIESLRSMQMEFERKFEELRMSGGRAWEELKNGVESSRAALSKALKSAKSKFK